ncbi:ModD protein [Thiomicrorhabdus xiamenensis]|uniref:Putative pyrophosphorylase ModD n=1 Tax=Thiomicrorhabdus xiamenensis TaxID=2739063 RepID=A0A7D4TG14_9GAMM|nr:ModD protein [Thiomicrorhabdus xiamenensis]QKI89288.1 ModD protein [Thiomicrorhabdus xiamenensis]
MHDTNQHNTTNDKMIYFQTHEIESWINEDAPLLDLTGHLLEINNQPARLSVKSRHATRLTMMEEAARIFELLGAEIKLQLPSGIDVTAETEILLVDGRADALHRGWKVAMNLLEYLCGVATHTAKMVAEVEAVGHIPLLVTRKHLPGMKKPMIKAISNGGAHPHRLGLSETILIFENHLNIIGGRDALKEKIPQIQQAACEKKISVECDTLKHALQAAQAGADLIQFDKIEVDSLSQWIAQLKNNYPHVKVIIAGGINQQNIRCYAQSGVDGIVLSSLYHAKPADLGVTITPLIK